MKDDRKYSTPVSQSFPRRRVLQAGAAIAGVSALGFPAIVRSQSDKLVIGHLTPLTGFLGALGEYAQIGREARAGGGQRLGRRAGAAGRADRGRLGQSGDRVDQGAAPARTRRCGDAAGRDLVGVGADHLAGGGTQQAHLREQRRALGRAARQELQPLHLPRRHEHDRQREGRGHRAAAREHDQGQETLRADRRLRVRPRPRARGQGLHRRQRRLADRRRTGGHRRRRLQPLPAQDPPGPPRRCRVQPGGQPGHHLPQAVRRVRPEIPDRRLQPEHQRRLGGGLRQLRRHLADRLAPRARRAGVEGLRRGVLEEVRQAAGDTTPGPTTCR